MQNLGGDVPERKDNLERKCIHNVHHRPTAEVGEVNKMMDSCVPQSCPTEQIDYDICRTQLMILSLWIYVYLQNVKKINFKKAQKAVTKESAS